VSNNKEGSISVVEQGDVEDSTVLSHEVFQVQPLVGVDRVINNVDLGVISSNSNLLLEPSAVGEDITLIHVNFSFVVLV
jgi:GMP synthase PP-ATPase subunit